MQLIPELSQRLICRMVRGLFYCGHWGSGADLTVYTAQVMKDEQGRPFIIVREYVFPRSHTSEKCDPSIVEDSYADRV